MFNLRYHVASLAAVFVALILGILVGVGLSASGITKQADLKAAKLQNADLSDRVSAAQAQIKSLQRTQNAFAIAYPAVMRNLLAGKRIAILFVGPIDGGIVQAIEKTLVDAGAGPTLRVLSVNVPIDAQKLDNALFAQGAQYAQLVGSDRLARLGSALASEFELGGQTPLWKVLSSQLVGERSGNARQRADGVVVVRSPAVKPQHGDTAGFLQGLYNGLAAAGAPAVGVEKAGTVPSAVPVFKDRGLSSVDDIDLATGRAALAFLLAGSAPGQYGISGDSQILPPVPSG
ncbi:MAG: copper transporter [Gaiellaceae bacterium]